ncbi:hypothetical protein HDU76_001327 [Blyttiomyces sp. JEL0837]|nr:hypothetical protein HDU76_001327 [Blyttiomyces sp. JEL0837]
MSHLLLHIPLRQQWLDDNDLVEAINEYDTKLWVISGCFGHVNYFKRMLEEFLDMPYRRLTTLFSIPITTLLEYIFRFAASEGLVDIAKLILDLEIEGIDVDASAEENDAIKSACLNGHLDMVTLLLEQRCVDPTVSEYRPFTDAVENGYLDILKALFNAVETEDMEKAAQKSLYSAALAGKLDIVKYLILELGVANVGFKDNIVFIGACRQGCLHVAQFLLGIDGVDPTDCESNALRAASECGHKEIVELLLAVPGIDPSAADNGAIRSAAFNGHVDIVKLLLNDQRVDATACNNEAIRSASRHGHTEIVEQLLKVPGVDATAYNYQAIFEALTNGRRMVVMALLGTDTVYPAKVGVRLLERAASKGYLDVVKILVEVKGVDPSANRDAAMRAACRGEYLDVIKYLAVRTVERVV